MCIRTYCLHWTPLECPGGYRSISGLINAYVDYDTHFPPGYEAGHTAGLRLLRVAATARQQFGPECIGPLYEAMGIRAFDDPESAAPGNGIDRGSRAFVEPALTAPSLPVELADAVEDDALDAELRAETDEALSLTGRDVGDADHPVQPAKWRCLLRPGDQPDLRS